MQKHASSCDLREAYADQASDIMTVQVVVFTADNVGLNELCHAVAHALGDVCDYLKHGQHELLAKALGQPKLLVLWLA